MAAANSASAVLVTGAGTGIGRAVVERLSRRGCLVFAGARREDERGALGALPGVVPLALDVTRPEDVRAAVEAVRRRAARLDGLVNNAGTGGLGPLASYTDADLAALFEINVFGPHRLARDFLPLLLPARGRIVNVGSMGGSISAPWLGPYLMTKHALEAFSAALAGELEPHGMFVSIVQPGAVATAIGDKARPTTEARLRGAPPPFDAVARDMLASLDEEPEYDPAQPESASNRRAAPPDEVAVVIEEALFSPEPRRRYLVGTRWEGNRVVRALLERLVDANACPSLGYTRDELVAWLDRELVAHRPPAN